MAPLAVYQGTITLRLRSRLPDGPGEPFTNCNSSEETGERTILVRGG